MTDSLTASEIVLIRDSFDRVSVGLRFSRNYYARLFEIAPELRALFPADLSVQLRKLMDMLAALVQKLDRPHELVLALEAVRPITPGRLVIVFGSDGDRDRGKRPIMGQIAARLADVLVVTDENPRSEDPASIRRAILDGALTERPDGRDVLEVEPRPAAVRRALELAGDADTVIVTGKGHEPTQEIAGVFHRYNDRDVFLAVRDERAGRVAR